MTDDQITARAKSDYRETGGVAYANPFPRGSDEFNAYERGWMQALKQDERPAFTPPPAPASEPTCAPVQQKPAVNLYALAKGRNGPRL